MSIFLPRVDTHLAPSHAFGSKTDGCILTAGLEAAYEQGALTRVPGGD